MAKIRKKKKQPSRFDLEQSALLQQLVELAEKLGYGVRMEEGQFQGGSCRMREDRLLIVNRKLPPDSKVKIVAAALSRMDLEDVFIVPALRAVIDMHRIEPETASLPE